MAKIEGYFVRFALTKGIQHVWAERVSEGDKRYLVYVGWRTAKEGVDFFTDREQAVAEAKALAHKRIAALGKQIKALEKLAENPKFEGQGGRREPGSTV